MKENKKLGKVDANKREVDAYLKKRKRFMRFLEGLEPKLEESFIEKIKNLIEWNLALAKARNKNAVYISIKRRDQFILKYTVYKEESIIINKDVLAHTLETIKFDSKESYLGNNTNYICHYSPYVTEKEYVRGYDAESLYNSFLDYLGRHCNIRIIISFDREVVEEKNLFYLIQ